MERRGLSPIEAVLDATKRSVAERKRLRPVAEVQARIRPRAQGRFLRALQQPGVSIVAEFKRRSLSEGILVKNPDLTDIVRQYERGGASAISVLTESTKFGGSPQDLETAHAACELPILCKDFIDDPYQVYEAAAAGADAILLIAAVLEDRDKLRGLHDLAHEIGLDVLVEVRSLDERERALNVGAELIGINNRNLWDLTIDPTTTQTLVQSIPEEVTVVSESGLRKPEDLLDLFERGVDAALIGTALMVASDPEATCRELREATSSVASSSRRPRRRAALV